MSKELSTRGTDLVRSVLDGVAHKAATVIDDLYRTEDDPKRNPDADKTWAECSMKTRASLILVKEAQAARDSGDPKVLGIVFMRGRIEDPKAWEQMANQVDEDERKRNAIDVPVDDE